MFKLLQPPSPETILGISLPILAMADLVSGAVQGLIGLLASAAYEEFVLAWGVKDDLEKLKGRLDTIKAEILDAEQRQRKDLEVRGWLMKLRQFCHDAEDVLDDFEAEALRRQAALDDGSIERKVP